jgi:hypothetical protein
MSEQTFGRGVPIATTPGPDECHTPVFCSGGGHVTGSTTTMRTTQTIHHRSHASARSVPCRRPTTPAGRPAVATGGARAVARGVYWRRRLVVVVLAAVLVVLMGQAGAALGGTAASTPERPPAVRSVVVRPGDSIWSIAERLAPGRDPRPVVDELVRERGGTALQPGETVEWSG